MCGVCVCVCVCVCVWGVTHQTLARPGGLLKRLTNSLGEARHLHGAGHHRLLAQGAHIAGGGSVLWEAAGIAVEAVHMEDVYRGADRQQGPASMSLSGTQRTPHYATSHPSRSA